MSASRYQTKYWNRLVNLKFQINYYYQYCKQDAKYDTWIKGFLAVTSNGSIAAWAIWKELQFIWALLIAGSQLLNALKSVLPFEKRRKIIEEFCYHLEKLFLEIERDWFYVSNGNLCDEEINNLITNFENRKEDLFRKYLQSIHLVSDKEEFIKKADSCTNDYFLNNFEVGVEDGEAE